MSILYALNENSTLHSRHEKVGQRETNENIRSELKHDTQPYSQNLSFLLGVLERFT